MRPEIRSARFVLSAPSVKLLPKAFEKEFAFIGRSNVGKSSLINMLTGKKNLALTSATPGKTRLMNVFRINEKFNFVDLPGYGFAKTGKEMREDLEGMITSYLQDRKQLTCLFVLIDIRLAMQAIDLDFLKWLGKNEIPFAIVYTKADKLTRADLEKNVKAHADQLLRWWTDLPGIFVTSSQKKTGRDDLLRYIFELVS